MVKLNEELFILNNVKKSNKYDLYIIEYIPKQSSIKMVYEFFVKTTNVPSVPLHGTLEYLKNIYSNSMIKLEGDN